VLAYKLRHGLLTVSLNVFPTAGVLDSVREGKMLSEAAYHVIENEVSSVDCHQMNSIPRNFADG